MIESSMTMERIGYFCRRHVLPLLLLPLLLSGCVDEFPVTTEVPYGGDGKGLSVEEALKAMYPERLPVRLNRRSMTTGSISAA